jgi:hypothetical protein
MKLCPKCGRKWPDTGKFCPFDGASLEEEKRAEPTDIRTSATVVMEVPKDLAALKKSTGASASEPASKKKQFSETQWFMKSIKPEDLEEITSHDDGDIATEQYVKKEEIKTEVRKKFSLSDTFRKHTPAEKKKAEGDAFLNLDRKVREQEAATPAPKVGSAPAPAPAAKPAPSAKKK